MNEKIVDILQREKDRLFQYASYRLRNISDAEDVLQDLYVTMVSKKRDINPESVMSYMFKTLSNICTTRLRTNCRAESLDNIDIPDVVESFEDEFLLINKLLSMIPTEQSEIIRLHLHSEMNFSEISEILELPLPTVKSRYRYGIGHIRNELKKRNYF